jgi:hypothetical protein
MSEELTITGSQNDVETLRGALFGRSVVSVRMFDNETPGPKAGYYERAQGEILLDDGTKLYLGGNVGGCSCGAGDYDLTRLNEMPINGITNVEVQATPKSENRYEDAYTYSVFILAQGLGPVELAAFEDDDGNGYYGTGFWFSIIKESV